MSRRRRTTEEDDLEEIRKGFDMFDVNGTGIIDPEELLEVMDSMNLKEKNPFIYEMIESLSQEKEFKKKGGVQLDELVNYVYNKVNDTESNVGIRQIYDVINDRDTDTVAMSTFYTLARDYGDQLSEDEIRELLEKTQMGGNELNFDEFYTIMKGYKKTEDRDDNMSSHKSSYRNKHNEVYVKKSSNNESLNSGDYSRKIRRKKYVSERPIEKEIPKDEYQDIPQRHERVEELITSTTSNLRYNQNQNNLDDIPADKEEIQTEIKYEIQEEQGSQVDTPLNYSYKKVIIGGAPKYEKVVERHINTEEEETGNFGDNLKIDDFVNNENNKDGNYKKERQTKVTRMPDGGKQIEITEKTEIEVERPISRGSRYRTNKILRDEESNNEDVKSETRGGTYYRVRRPRGSEKSNNNSEEQRFSFSKVEVEENNDVIIPKRYHRRYRDSKVSNNNEN